METDAELMLRTRAGDDAAFAEIVDRYKDRLVNYLSRLAGSRTDGEEHAQEAFFRLFRLAGRFRRDARIEPLLFRIATNLVRSAARREKLRRVLHLRAATAPLAEPPALESLLSDEAQQRVQSAIARLPERFREAVLLRDIEGWGHADMARALGCTTGTVKSRIARGRARLRAELTPFWNGGKGRKGHRNPKQSEKERTLNYEG